MSNPDVSVILPTYNRADTLPRAISSVLCQTLDTFELVVVDDGSDNDVEHIINDFSDSRIEFYAHGANKGANAARNTGLEHSNSNMIAFIDSDDEWHRDKLKIQLDYLSASPSDRVAVYCDYNMHHQSMRRRIRNVIKRVWPYDYQKVSTGGAELIEDLLMIQLDVGGASNLMVRKTVLDDIGGFDERLRRHTDWDLLIRLLQRGNIGYVDRTLTHRYGEMNCSVDALIRAKRKFLTKHADLVDRLQKRDVPVVDRHKLTVVKKLLANRRFVEARRFFNDTDNIILQDIPGLAWALAIGSSARVL